MPEGNNIPKTSPSFSGASSVSSPSLVMRALAQSRALDGGFQKSSTMWNQVTRNRYPSGKMKVIGSSSSRKKDIGLQEDMDAVYEIIDEYEEAIEDLEKLVANLRVEVAKKKDK